MSLVENALARRVYARPQEVSVAIPSHSINDLLGKIGIVLSSISGIAHRPASEYLRYTPVRAPQAAHVDQVPLTAPVDQAPLTVPEGKNLADYLNSLSGEGIREFQTPDGRIGTADLDHRVYCFKQSSLSR